MDAPAPPPPPPVCCRVQWSRGRGSGQSGRLLSEDTAPFRAAQPRCGSPCPSAGRPPAARSNPCSSFRTELQPQSLRSHRPCPSTINNTSSPGAPAGCQEPLWATSRPCSPPSGRGQSAGTRLGWGWVIWHQRSLVTWDSDLTGYVRARVVTHLFRVYPCV